MLFYRGDDRSPLDSVIQTIGFTAKPPAVTMSSGEARQFLSKELASKQIGLLAHGWRESTPGFLIATAMKMEGAFEQKKYLYKIEIPDNMLSATLIDDSGNFGSALPIQNALETTSYFVIYDGNNYQTASMIAFGHGKVNTKEATFITAIPREHIVGYRQTSLTLFKPGESFTKERMEHYKNVPFAPMRKVGVNLDSSQLIKPKEGPKRLVIPNIFQ